MNAEAAPFVPPPEAEKEPPDDAKNPADADAEPGDAKEAKAAAGATAEAASAGHAYVNTSYVEGESSGLWKPRYHGRLRSFNEVKGFGFIDCQETLRSFGRDVFVHRYQITESGVCVGQEVMFEVELNKEGHPQARRLQPADWAWDNSGWGSSFPAYPGYGGDGWYGSGSFGGKGSDYSRSYGRGGKGGGSHSSGTDGTTEKIEGMLRKCSGTDEMYEIIEQYGQLFEKKNVVTALYQLGLCRQYESKSGAQYKSRSLTGALVDRMVKFDPRELTADEASRVLWALAGLEEVQTHEKAQSFSMELGQEASRRYHEFSPSQMATFISSLSKLVRNPEVDELVSTVTTNFSDFALGSGSMPRFPPEELKQWTDFLQSAASGGPGSSPTASPMAQYPSGMPTKGGSPKGGQMPPQFAMQQMAMMSSMPGMPSSFGKGGIMAGGSSMASGMGPMNGRGDMMPPSHPDGCKGFSPSGKGFGGAKGDGRGLGGKGDFKGAGAGMPPGGSPFAQGPGGYRGPGGGGPGGPCGQPGMFGGKGGPSGPNGLPPMGGPGGPPPRQGLPGMGMPPGGPKQVPFGPGAMPRPGMGPCPPSPGIWASPPSQTQGRFGS